MDKAIEDLYKKFLDIKNKGFIKSLRRGTSSVGYTFEKLIGKAEENFPIPDYKGIEIKTSRRTSWGKIHLFHATPDGDYLFPIKTILDVLGYPDKDYPEYNVFNYNVNARFFTNVECNKKVKINVDRKNKKICLTARDKYNNHLDLPISWSFEMLEKRLFLKLKYLALVKATCKKENIVEYFKYDKINFYKLKDFDTFIDLIDSGIIIITFMIGMHKSKKRFGQIHDHGTAFTINEKYISLLYDEISII